MIGLGRRSTYPVDVLWCANARNNGWRFPPNVARRLQTDHAGKSILHLFGGEAAFGTRLDVDPVVRPDVIGDAWLPPFAKDSFDVVILDPPYVRFNTQVKCALFRAAGWIARERVVWFHTIWASQAYGLKTERTWLVRCGDGCYVRALQYFRVDSKPGPVKYFKRGPAMKYNRWLAQPNSLGLQDVAP